MSLGIDHLVLAVQNLDAAATEYKRLGFTLTPRAQHPFGTGNQLAQFGDDFLEILAVTQSGDISEHEDGVVSFGAFNRDFLSTREGMSMIALKSSGWEVDRKQFSSAGLNLAEPFEFSRLARQPDGGDVTVGFKLTFVPDPAAPEAMFFTCDHQHAPEYFYKPDFQKHQNGARAISEVMMVADDPLMSQDYFSRLYGEVNVVDDDGCLRVQGAGSQISVLSPEVFSERYPGSGVIPFSGERTFRGCRILVDDIEETRSVFEANGVEHLRKTNNLWVMKFGTILEFSARSEAKEI